jgi:hypothetical protein
MKEGSSVNEEEQFEGSNEGLMSVAHDDGDYLTRP